MSIPFTIVAKAGGSREGAENTCELIERTLAVPRPDGIGLAVEVDVRLSADAVAMVIHDASLERTTNGRGAVSATSATALGRLVAGPRGERVPRLEDVLALVMDAELVVELHDGSDDMLGALLTALGRVPKALSRVIVASEDDALVRKVRGALPQLRTAATAREAWKKLLLERVHLENWATRGHHWIVPVEHRGLRVVTRRFVESAKRAGDPVWCYVVDSCNEAQQLRNMGVAGCFTTRPRSLAAALAQGLLLEACGA